MVAAVAAGLAAPPPLLVSKELLQQVRCSLAWQLAAAEADCQDGLHLLLQWRQLALTQLTSANAWRHARLPASDGLPLPTISMTHSDAGTARTWCSRKHCR